MRTTHALKASVRKTAAYRAMRNLLSPRYRRQQRLGEQFIKAIRERGHDTLLRKYGNSDPACGKYLDLDYFVPEVVGEAANLDLLGPPCRRVLDIGCGAGYFMFVLKHFGHDVQGIDIPDAPPLYTEMLQILELPRVNHKVVKFQPLPFFDKPFDLITAFSIVFDRIEDVWGVDEWRYFVEDCRSHLTPNGRLCFNFNPGRVSGVPYVSDEVANMLAGMKGGQVSACKEFFILDNNGRSEPGSLPLAQEAENAAKLHREAGPGSWS